MWPAIIGAIGSIAGGLLNRPQAGNSGPANINNYTSTAQANQAYQGNVDALKQQQDFLAALQGQGGIGNQSNVFQQQQDLANQLQMQAMGQGPNPALAQLANTTGQNMNQQAALMASQRGASANPALVARQAAMQGGALQQQSAGQAAAMQAQQQLAAQQALMQQQSQMAQLAGQQVSQQGNALGNVQAGASNLYGQVTGNINAANNAAIGAAAPGQQASGAMQLAQFNNQNNQVNNAISGISKAFIGGAGGENQKQGFADGGYVEGGPRSRVGRHFLQFKDGGYVPGNAEVSGDHPENDKVQALLSPDEIVIPRSIVLSKNAPEKAAMFVQACLAKKGMK